jgi:hypothetical protein
MTVLEWSVLDGVGFLAGTFGVTKYFAVRQLLPHWHCGNSLSVIVLSFWAV